MNDIKFVIIDKEEVPLDQLSTSELADRADSHNPAAYAAASEQDLSEPQFRAALLEILGGAADHSAADKEALTCAIRTAAVAALVVDSGGDLWGAHPNYPKSDWRYEVENGDTMLGYWEWVHCKLEEAETDSEAGDA